MQEVKKELLKQRGYLGVCTEKCSNREYFV